MLLLFEHSGPRMISYICANRKREVTAAARLGMFCREKMTSYHSIPHSMTCNQRQFLKRFSNVVTDGVLEL